jgi:hypothetical protein
MMGAVNYRDRRPEQMFAFRTGDPSPLARAEWLQPKKRSEFHQKGIRGQCGNWDRRLLSRADLRPRRLSGTSAFDWWPP